MDIKQLDEIMLEQLKKLAEINNRIADCEPELVAKNAEVMLDIYINLRPCLQVSTTFDEPTQ